jgi:hypothetical protein
MWIRTVLAILLPVLTAVIGMGSQTRNSLLFTASIVTWEGFTPNPNSLLQIFSDFALS